VGTALLESFHFLFYPNCPFANNTGWIRQHVMCAVGSYSAISREQGDENFPLFFRNFTSFTGFDQWSVFL
jgi:hypothetical protein